MHSTYNAMGFLGYTLTQRQHVELEAAIGGQFGLPDAGEMRRVDLGEVRARNSRSRLSFKRVRAPRSSSPHIPGWHMENSVEPLGRQARTGTAPIPRRCGGFR